MQIKIKSKKKPDEVLIGYPEIRSEVYGTSGEMRLDIFDKLDTEDSIQMRLSGPEARNLRDHLNEKIPIKRETSVFPYAIAPGIMALGTIAAVMKSDYEAAKWFGAATLITGTAGFIQYRRSR